MTGELIPARSHPSHRSARARAEQRRVDVARYLHAGHTEAEIAAFVGCAPSTVHSDVVQLRRQWYESYFADVNDSIARDLSRLDAGITAIWPRVLASDPKALDAIVRATELKAKIQGVVPSGVRMDVTNYVQAIAVEAGHDPAMAMAVAEEVVGRLR